MKGAPELMTEALNLHNAVIRKVGPPPSHPSFPCPFPLPPLHSPPPHTLSGPLTPSPLQARWTTFGYIIEQEGDSYTLCFYEALDAVTFALMVGQRGGGGETV